MIFEACEARNFEVSSGISQTLPNQSLTILEILERYTRGFNINSHNPQYDVTDEINDDDALEVYDKDDNPDELTALDELRTNAETSSKNRQTEKKRKKELEQEEKEFKQFRDAVTKIASKTSEP